VRIRTVKPEFWTSKAIAKLAFPTRLLFVGLWNYADDEGRGLADPVLVRAAIFPLDRDLSDDDVAAMLQELHRARLLTLYRALPEGSPRSGGGSELFAIRSWSEHQRIDRPRASRYPAPRKHRRTSGRPRRTLDEDSSKPRRRNGSGMEQGREVGSDRALVEVDPNQGSLFESENGSTSPASPVEPPSRGPRHWSEIPNPWGDDVEAEQG